MIYTEWQHIWDRHLQYYLKPHNINTYVCKIWSLRQIIKAAIETKVNKKASRFLAQQ